MSERAGDDLVMMYLPEHCVYRVLHRPTGASVDVPREAIYSLSDLRPPTEGQARRRLLGLVRDQLLALHAQSLPAPVPHSLPRATP